MAFAASPPIGSEVRLDVLEAIAASFDRVEGALRAPVARSVKQSPL